MTTSAMVQHQLELHVMHRGANRRGAVGQDGHLHRSGQGGLELGQQLLDAIHDLDDVGAGLPLDVEDDRRRHRSSRPPV